MPKKFITASEYASKLERVMFQSTYDNLCQCILAASYISNLNLVELFRNPLSPRITTSVM